eukprot:TRINITY_DN38194_c0_g1_i1.p1 TRINITY_DN38194_c0_g1~~TRINITY_DN38194_c0_g1_i1.p1  ORF type:complete len:483 (-),score=99.06 TRINITY_DN38194_c0_g1_i1:425-1873(-)
MANFDIMQIALAVVGANSSVATLVVLGATATYMGIWDKQGISDLGKLVFHMSMPALVFSKVLVEISLEALQELWVLPLMCALHIFSAYAITSLLNRTLGITGSDAKAALAMTMFGNCGSLAIAVLQALCLSEPLMSRMGGAEKCTSKGVSYCAIYVIAWNIFIWGVGDAMLFPDEETEGNEKDYLVVVSPASTAREPLRPVSRVTSVESLQGQEPFSRSRSEGFSLDGQRTRLARLADDEDGCSSTTTHSRARRRLQTCHLQASNRTIEVELVVSKEQQEQLCSRIVGCSAYNFHTAHADAESRAKAWKDKLAGAKAFCSKLVKSPPIQAATLAFILGLYPPVKALFVGKDAPLNFVVIAMNQLGNAQVDLNTFAFSARAKFLCLFGRLLIMPVVGFFWSWLLVRQGWFPGDPEAADYGRGMLAFIVLIEACVPTAQSIVTMFIVHGDIIMGGALAELILGQYAISIVLFSAAAAYFEYLTL